MWFFVPNKRVTAQWKNINTAFYVSCLLKGSFLQVVFFDTQIDIIKNNNI